MPREQINIPPMPRVVYYDIPGMTPADVAPGTRQSGQIENYVDPALHVSWMGNEEIGMPPFVQAGMEVHRSQVLSQAKWLEENPNELAAWFWTPTLTRPETQNLIRTTRRARDRVFGGDE